MNLKSQKSQSTIEFLIVLVVIIAAVLIGAQNFLKPAVRQMMNNIAEVIRNSTNKLKGL